LFSAIGVVPAAIRIGNEAKAQSSSLDARTAGAIGICRQEPYRPSAFEAALKYSRSAWPSATPFLNFKPSIMLAA